jgi:glutaredoxin
MARRTADRTAGPARWQLLTRDGCHLCDDMARLLDEEITSRGSAYETVDVDAPGHERLRERYGETVPVLLRDGVAVAKVRVDRARLRRIIDRRR